MKKQIEETKIEVVFNENLKARNKLIDFIINKIVEDYTVFEGMINGNKNDKRGGYSGDCSK